MIFQKNKTIVVHSGRFHADDLFAAAIMMEYFDGKAKIIRSVDPKVIAKADYVFDVGGIYNPVMKRFDHHQGGVGARENGISYASAGLAWKHFGEKTALSKKAADKVDEKLIVSIDAFDTGDISPRPFKDDLYPYLLDDVARVFGNTWKETNRDETKSFMFMLPFARAILRREIINANASIEAENLVLDAYEKSADKRIVVTERYLPVGALEDKEEVLYVVSPENRSHGWAVRTMRKNKHEYGNRKDLPSEWAGKNGEELAKISGVPDAIFCHLKLFIAVAKSKEGAIALAKKAVER